MTEIHLSTARKIMQRGEFSISWLTQSGEKRHADRAVSLKYDMYTGTRSIKCQYDDKPPKIRRIRDVLITHINDIEVYV